MADDFESLPEHLQQHIDAAFDAVSNLHSHRPPPRKRRRLSPPPELEPAGGFIIEDSHATSSEEEQEANDIPSESDVIPLSSIPAALQRLDLAPDDEEILQVFRNAASGWRGIASIEDNLNGTSKRSDEQEVVSRKDWRAVCAVVLDGREDDVLGHPVSTSVVDAKNTDLAEEKSLPDPAGEWDEEDEGDIYEEDSMLSSSSSFSLSGQESDSDASMAMLSKSKSERKSRSNRSQARSDAPGVPTVRQRREALETYALFFPASPKLTDKALTANRLTSKDVSRVAELLKEKIKANEITEMISFFSISPDGSMGFEDFIRMMIAAKLV